MEAECVVISQPMFFPWVGLFEQVRLANIYVHYGDVQFSKGSFVNRVQIKTAHGPKWITVPLEGLSLGQSIDDVKVGATDWKRRHLGVLEQSYADAPHVELMLELVSSVYSREFATIGELSKASLEAVCNFYGLHSGRRFLDVRDLGIEGTGSQRVLEIVRALGGKTYVTGWGARNYLAHERFERERIAVEYMNYEKVPYPQLHGAFNPSVSVLDLIANTGKSGVDVIRSKTVNWKHFLKSERD
jgi:WbqC-like protein family